MKRIFATILAILLTLPAQAQQSEDESVRAEINFVTGLPQGDLGDHLDGEAFGLGAFIGGRIPGSPVVLGSELAFVNYGTASNLQLYRTVFDDGIDEDLAVPLEAVRTSVSNNVLLGHLVGRLEPLQGPIQPYLDALAGVKYFITQSSVDGDVVIFRNGLSQVAHTTDLAFSYGLGGGLEVDVYRHESRWSEAPMTVSIQAGARYLFGTPARYALESSMRGRDGRVFIEEVESRTDMVMLQFGLRVRR